MITTRTSLAFLALGIGACGGSGADVDATAPADARVAELEGACPLADRVGWFDIAHDQLASSVTGKVNDSVNPIAVLQPEESAGDCQLLRKVNPFCDPPCTGGDVCSQDQQCVPFPSGLGAGQVTITGLTTPVAIDPDTQANYQALDVDHPPFSPGTPILLHAAGDQVVSFDLDGIGVEPLVVADTSWPLVDGDPLEITWTPASGDWRILATFNVDQHGNSPVTMYCDLPDTGSATIPAALIATLIDYGVTGAASGHLYRRTVDSTRIAEGCVELEVYSHIRTQLAVQ